jgi:hypothetical protein
MLDEIGQIGRQRGFRGTLLPEINTEPTCSDQAH